MKRRARIINLQLMKTPRVILVMLVLLFGVPSPGPAATLPVTSTASLGSLNPDQNVTFNTDVGTFQVGGIPALGGRLVTVFSNHLPISLMAFDFADITIPQGVTIKALGARPLVLLARGSAVVNGIIDVSGQRGGDAGLDGGGGGGGGGGAVAVFANSIMVGATGQVLARGGNGGQSILTAPLMIRQGGPGGLGGPSGGAGGAGGSSIAGGTGGKGGDAGKVGEVFVGTGGGGGGGGGYDGGGGDGGKGLQAGVAGKAGGNGHCEELVFGGKGGDGGSIKLPVEIVLPGGTKIQDVITGGKGGGPDGSGGGAGNPGNDTGQPSVGGGGGGGAGGNTLGGRGGKGGAGNLSGGGGGGGGGADSCLTNKTKPGKGETGGPGGGVGGAGEGQSGEGGVNQRSTPICTGGGVGGGGFIVLGAVSDSVRNFGVLSAVGSRTLCQAGGSGVVSIFGTLANTGIIQGQVVQSAGQAADGFLMSGGAGGGGAGASGQIE